MSYFIIIASSVTYAMKAKSELIREGISCRIEKIKKIANLKGCGYGVVVRANELDRAVRLMKSTGIRIIDVMPYKDGER